MEGLILYGSPHENGHTKKILEAIIRNTGIQYELVDVYKKDINPCIDCKYCYNVEGKCSIKDDMNNIYDKIKSSKYIILASPMYFGMFPSKMKALIDRTQVQWCEKNIFKQKTSKDKFGVFLFTAGASWDNMFTPMETIGRYFFNTVGCNINYKVYIDNTDQMDNNELNKAIERHTEKLSSLIRSNLSKESL